MKTIEKVRVEWKCPNGHSEKHYSFNAENAYCEICKAHYDLGMKKYH